MFETSIVDNRVDKTEVLSENVKEKRSTEMEGIARNIA